MHHITARAPKDWPHWCGGSKLADPFSGAVYVFRAKRADRIKLIFWDGTGLCLFAKRLEDGIFRWPKIEDGVMRLSAAQASFRQPAGLIQFEVRSGPRQGPEHEAQKFGGIVLFAAGVVVRDLLGFIEETIIQASLTSARVSFRVHPSPSVRRSRQCGTCVRQRASRLLGRMTAR
ncbi:IS66 family insertion sequence element accessory protein TnpB [Bradyrhizobium sp. AC87j1]|uniref:IS66 family insertion sequence element accessory protein TnpB n=1 Tax=Bradyrhizobium sp. AC87j1 TaxID=2055894 RepID=UPI001AED0FA0|nr:IS66 family insertion sequence element accessory protein TnpB [Bradyrhizobium sp. AC87j1]